MLSGGFQLPQENGSRLTDLCVCQFHHKPHKLIRLYANEETVTTYSNFASFSPPPISRVSDGHPFLFLIIRFWLILVISKVRNRPTLILYQFIFICQPKFVSFTIFPAKTGPFILTYQTVQSPGHYAHLMWILVMTIVPQFNAVYAVSRYAILRIWE